LLALLASEGVTVLSQTPSAFYALQTVVTAHPELPLQLDAVVLGGEDLAPQRLAEWRRDRRAAARLINMYGITETTVHASFREIVDHDIHSGGSPIGQPLPSLAFAVLDA
ncbi:AMP-binding protein, partial [Mycobacterium simiae]